MPRHLPRRDSRGVLLVQPRINENDSSASEPVISHRRRKYSTVGLPYTHQRDYYARLNARRQSHSQQTAPTDMPTLSPPLTKRRPSIRAIRRRSSHNPRLARYVVRETSSDIEIDAYLTSDDADDMDADEAAQWASSFSFPAPRRRKSDNVDATAEDSDQHATTITPVSDTFSFSSSDAHADGERTPASSVGPFDGVECTWGTPLSSPQSEEAHTWYSSLPPVGKFESQQSIMIPAESGDQHMKNATAERRQQTLAALHRHIAQLSAALRATTNNLELSVIGLHVALERTETPSSDESDSDEDQTPRSSPQPSDTSLSPSAPSRRASSSLLAGARERLRGVEFETGKTLALVALLTEDVTRFEHLE